MFHARNVCFSVELTLDIVDYQFPGVAEDDWCLVELAIRHGPLFFEKRDSSLEAADLPRIADWFLALAERRLPRFARLTFSEPCLAFAFIGADDAAVRISVDLDADLRPNFPLNQLGATTTDWSVVFELSSCQLAITAMAIREKSLKFPSRRCPIPTSQTG